MPCHANSHGENRGMQSHDYVIIHHKKVISRDRPGVSASP